MGDKNGHVSDRTSRRSLPRRLALASLSFLVPFAGLATIASSAGASTLARPRDASKGHGPLAGRAPVVAPVPFGPVPSAGLGKATGAVSPSTAVALTFVLEPAAHARAAAGARALVGWLESEHFRTTPEFDGLHVSSTAAGIASLLHVRFAEYRDTGLTVYASTQPYVPADVAPLLSSILGLSSAPVAQPDVTAVPVPGAPHASTTSAVTASGAPAACSTATSIQQNYGVYPLTYVGNHYGVNNLFAAGHEGSGVTIAVVEFAASVASDIKTYDSCFGLPYANYSVVPVDGGAGSAITNGSVEADLDIEQLQTQAPLAKVVSYEAGNTSSAFYDDLNAIVTADTAKVISISWYMGCESQLPASYVASYSALFAKAAAQGQSVFIASGDTGSLGCSGLSGLNIQYPSSDPSVTAVGGTNIATSPDSVWNDCSTATNSSCSASGGGAGGGGISTMFAKPAWQAAVNTTAHRETPDISAYADTRNLIYFNGGWNQVGGTSAAAPLVAGMVADVVPTCATAIGNIAPRLYAYAAAGGYGTALTDVTVGNNDFTDATSHKSYVAATGYDTATGLGEPIATGLACPTLTSLSPATGATGSTVTIAGANLSHATVTFGSAPALVTASSATSLSVTVPAGSGSSTVTVANPIGAGPALPFTYVGAPTITSAAVLAVTAGKAFSFPVVATGTPTPTITVSGTLPAGVTFSAGTFAGTVQASADGTYSLTVRATNASGTATQSLVVTVGSAPVISTGTASLLVGTPGSLTVQATPSTGVTFSSAALPAGLSFKDNGNGAATISGTPATADAGVTTVQITATNSYGSTTSPVTITVNAAPLLSAPPASNLIVGAKATTTVQATGYPAPVITGSGKLPAGMTFSAGVLSGTPLAGAAGSYSIVVSATNAVGTVTVPWVLTVGAGGTAPALVASTSLATTPGSATAAEQIAWPSGTTGTIAFSAPGSPAPTLVESGTLPAGTAVGAGAPSGSLSLTGSPTVAGSYPVTVTATGASGSSTLNVVIVVALAFTSPATVTFAAGHASSLNVTTDASSAKASLTTGSLPAGVTFVATSTGGGLLSGTPAMVAGAYPLVLSATYGTTVVTQSFTLTVTVPATPTFTSAATTTFTAGQSGTFAVTTGSATTGSGTVGSTTAATLSLASGSLPAGISFTPGAGTALGTATISGTPTAAEAGSYPLVLAASNGVQATQSFTLVITAPSTPVITVTGSGPAITTSAGQAVASWTHGQAGSVQVVMSGNLTSIQASGTMPPGVTPATPSVGTFIFSGTPTYPGTYTLNFTVTNAAGTSHLTLTFVVA